MASLRFFWVGILVLSASCGKRSAGNDDPSLPPYQEPSSCKTADECKASCTAQDFEACARLGSMLMRGWGPNGWGDGPKDETQALAASTAACEHGRSRGCANVASLVAGSKPPEAWTTDDAGMVEKACLSGAGEWCVWLTKYRDRVGDKPGAQKSRLLAEKLLKRSCFDHLAASVFDCKDLARFTEDPELAKKATAAFEKKP